MVGIIIDEGLSWNEQFRKRMRSEVDEVVNIYHPLVACVILFYFEKTIHSF